MKTWILRVFIVAGVCWGFKELSSFCHQQTGGFTILGISSHRPFNAMWETNPLSNSATQEVKLALNQKYSYLFSGGQAVVFASEDGQYVIKFFDQSRLQPRFLARHLPRQFFDEKKLAKKLWKRENKLDRDFSSYKLAFDELKDETGLLLVHLNPTNWIQKKLTLVDKIHIEHQIDLDGFEFILQKRAELVYPRLERLVKAGDEDGAKEALCSILQLFVTRCQKGIDDSDPDLDKNFGFIGSQAVQIDTGRFTKHTMCSRYHQRNSPLETVVVRAPVIKESFKKWLVELDPKLLSYFETEYQQLCAHQAFTPQL